CGEFIDEYLDQVILLYTIDTDGWAHPSLLSYFEVAATDRSTVRLATYKDSNTTENMRRREKVTLSLFGPRVAYTIKGRATVMRHEMHSLLRNSMLKVRVDKVLVDAADPSLEPDTHIASGITCLNPNARTERTWRNDVLRELME